MRVYSSTSPLAYNALTYVKALQIGSVQIPWVGFSRFRDAQPASVIRRATGLFTQQQGPGEGRPASMLGRLQANSPIVSSLIGQQIQHSAPMRSAGLMVQHHIKSIEVRNSWPLRTNNVNKDTARCQIQPKQTSSIPDAVFTTTSINTQANKGQPLQINIRKDREGNNERSDALWRRMRWRGVRTEGEVTFSFGGSSALFSRESDGCSLLCPT